MRAIAIACCTVAAVALSPARAAELKPETAASFDRYVAAVEARMDEEIGQNRFLVIDRLPAARRRAVCGQLQKGQLYVEALRIREDDRPMRIENGLLNHWVGVIFIPGANLSGVLSVLRDYDNHHNIYKPQIRRSKLIERNEDRSEVHLQLFGKSLVTVVFNADFDVTETAFSATRFQIALRSMRIAEVVNPDKPDEYELPVGIDHGYLWRFESYWRLVEADGGVYAQNESVVLSRSVPAIFAWLLSSLTHGIPRDILTRLLIATRKAVLSNGPIDRSGPVPAPLP